VRGLVPFQRERAEASALAGAVVLDGCAAQRLDHPLQVEVAVGVLLGADPGLGPAHSAAVEGPDAELGQRAGDLLLETIEAVVLDQHPEEVLVVPAVPAL